MNKKLLRALLALLLALLSTLPMAAAEADVPPSAFEDDGVVRVYLKSLGAPDNLTLTLDGVYTVEHDAGFRFDRGTQIVLSIDEGRIWLSVGGLTLDMGPTLTLTRQLSLEEENGLRIAETGRETLYPGDLTVCPEEGGGLRSVLHVNMEDYLCGVVAYEMSDSWPLEALKAQAVAARTYAMQRKQIAGKRDYDLMDTTADQVFKGIDAEYANVRAAVRATEGVVGMWKGEFATCYYTASNGGQTALPTDVWIIEGDFGYLERTTDPYDVENPNSMVSSVSFAPDVSDLPALREMLQEGLGAAAEAQGFDPESVELKEVVSIRPIEAISPTSRMFTKLRFTVSAAMAEKEKVSDAASFSFADYLRGLLGGGSGEPETQLLPESFAVELDVYEQVKDGLGLAINGSDYELVSVVKRDDSFSIEMRRFGHGVGMSQRGAQRMAGVHGKGWQEILSFYYPGMALEKIEWDTPALQAIEALPEGIGAARPDPTPTPTPAPLPALGAGEYYAAVALGDASSSLNMRQSPTTQSPIVTQLGNGRRVIVSGEMDADGWVAIRTAEFSGYAKLEYLTRE